MTVAEKTQLSLRLPTDLLASLDRIATTLERDRTWVIRRALRAYVETGEGAELLDVEKGLAQLVRGESFDFDEVLAEGDEVIARAEAERKLKKAG